MSHRRSVLDLSAAAELDAADLALDADEVDAAAPAAGRQHLSASPARTRPGCRHRAKTPPALPWTPSLVQRERLTANTPECPWPALALTPPTSPWAPSPVLLELPAVDDQDRYRTVPDTGTTANPAGLKRPDAN